MVSTPTVAQAAAQLLERCRQEKHLSIAGVAAALGYRSPNSVERIAKGSAGHTACCKFLESARRVYPELFPGEDGGSVHGRAAENAWLLRYDGRVVRIRFDWTPTAAQMSAAAEKLTA